MALMQSGPVTYYGCENFRRRGAAKCRCVVIPRRGAGAVYYSDPTGKPAQRIGAPVSEPVAALPPALMGGIAAARTRAAAAATLSRLAAATIARAEESRYWDEAKARRAALAALPADLRTALSACRALGAALGVVVAAVAASRVEIRASADMTVIRAPAGQGPWLSLATPYTGLDPLDRVIALVRGTGRAQTVLVTFPGLAEDIAGAGEVDPTVNRFAGLDLD